MAKTKITKKEVEHIAELIMVRLTNKEIAKFRPQLGEILDFAGKLQDIDTSKLIETHQVTGLANVLRQDKITPSLPPKDALSNAAQTEDGFFKIPGKLYL